MHPHGLPWIALQQLLRRQKVFFAGGRIEARRATWSQSSPRGDGTLPRLLDEETVSAGGLGCTEVRYHQRSTGLDVTVICEDETLGEPPARALTEPEAP